jgi:hypothetical protein
MSIKSSQSLLSLSKVWYLVVEKIFKMFMLEIMLCIAVLWCHNEKLPVLLMFTITVLDCSALTYQKAGYITQHFCLPWHWVCQSVLHTCGSKTASIDPGRQQNTQGWTVGLTDQVELGLRPRCTCSDRLVCRTCDQRSDQYPDWRWIPTSASSSNCPLNPGCSYKCRHLQTYTCWGSIQWVNLKKIAEPD